MVVAPIRSKMAPKSGKERASSTIRAMTDSLKTTLVRLNSATQQGRRLTVNSTSKDADRWWSYLKVF